MIAFRVDGGNTIGTGHIMRCLSLAKAFREIGRDSTFITADHTAEELISEAGFALYCLNSDLSNMEEELTILLPLLQKIKADFLIADSYLITPRWMKGVRRVQPLAYLDDENRLFYPADVVINYNLSGLEKDYSKYTGTDTKLVIGPLYAPLREEFSGLPQRKVAPVVKNVLVSTGGADSQNVAGQLLELISNKAQWRDISFCFVVGRLNPHASFFKKNAAMLPNVRIYTDVARMSELMLCCDVAIAAAGSTLYELCACGTPTVTYALADNQLAGAQIFERHELMLNAGDCRKNKDFGQNVAQHLEQLSQGTELRQKMSTAMQAMIDGKGAVRLAKKLLEIFGS